MTGVLLLANAAFWIGRQFAAPPGPRVYLWAWERPEDLSFLDCTSTGVAFLAKTVITDGQRIGMRPRLQPIVIPDGCPTIAVVRIESTSLPLGTPHVGPVLREILDVAREPRLIALQIDFDALESQRSFYADLLRRLRQEMPSDLKLSITALASWCMWDDWITPLPIDEAVPMLFRVGIDHDRVRRYLAEGNDFRVATCRSSLGLSTDEWFTTVPHGRRLYIFHPESWSASAASDILKKAGALR